MNLHCADSTASIAAQPLGGGVATEKKALSIPLHRDGMRGNGSREPKSQAPLHGSWGDRARRGWGSSTRSPSGPRGPSSIVGLLPAHCPSLPHRQAGAGRRIGLPSQPPSFKSVATAGEEGRRGALALFVLLNPML